jgi:hypothetical protein
MEWFKRDSHISNKMQTVEIKYPFSDQIFKSMEYCPRAPADIRKRLDNERNIIASLKGPGYKTAWYSNWCVTRVYSNGTEKHWYTKPTLSDIVVGSSIWKGSYFRFHNDGTVECRIDNGTSIWHPGTTPTIDDGAFRIATVDKQPCYCEDNSCGHEFRYQDCGLCINTCSCEEFEPHDCGVCSNDYKCDYNQPQ